MASLETAGNPPEPSRKSGKFQNAHHSDSERLSLQLQSMEVIAVLGYEVCLKAQRGLIERRQTERFPLCFVCRVECGAMAGASREGRSRGFETPAPKPENR